MRRNLKLESQKPPTAVLQRHPSNSCDGAGTMCTSGPFQRRGEGGSAAWVTALPPYTFTQALGSGKEIPV